MPILYVLSGPEVGKSFSVRAGDTLGRAPDRILTLRHPSISRQHAHIEEQEGVWYVVDDGSQNGVLFEGQRSARIALHDAAEFRLGEILLRFRLDAPAAPTQPAGTSSGAPSEAPVEEEIFLEGADEELLAPAPPRPAPAREEPSARPRRAAEERRRPEQRPAAGGPGALAAERRVLQYHRHAGGAGVGAGDLAQYPGWVRWLAVLLGILLAVAAGWFAYRGTAFVKQEVRGAPVAPEAP